MWKITSFDWYISTIGWAISTLAIFVFSCLGIIYNISHVPAILIFTLFISVVQYILFFKNRCLSLNIAGIELFIFSIMVWPIYFPLPEENQLWNISFTYQILLSSVFCITFLVFAQSCFSEAKRNKLLSKNDIKN